MTAKGFVELVDDAKNAISVPMSRVEALIEGGWRRVDDPPKKKRRPPPEAPESIPETGSE